MNINFFLVQITVLAVALIYDTALGEFPESIHPVVWVGKFIERLDLLFRKHHNKIFSGTVFVVFVESVFIVFLIIIQDISLPFVAAYVIVSAFFLKSSFAMKSMRDHVKPIIRALEKNNLDEARMFLSRTVRRDTKDLDRGLICSAAVETVSEGLVDGFTGPMFYFSFFLTPGSFFYRISNTFDSEIGYNDSRNSEFGRFAARLDTAMNFIPARMTAYFVYLSSFIMGMHTASYRLRDMSQRTKSRNAGWPMTSFSNIMGIRLEKKGDYVINENFPFPDTEDIRISLKIHAVSGLLFTLLFTVPVILIIYLLL